MKEFLDIDLGSDFLAMIPNTDNQSKNKQMGLYQTKQLLHSKRNNSYNEKVTYGMEEIIYNLQKRLISKIHRPSSALEQEKKNLIKKWAKKLTVFPKEHIQITKKYIKMCPTSLISET